MENLIADFLHFFTEQKTKFGFWITRNQIKGLEDFLEIS